MERYLLVCLLICVIIIIALVIKLLQAKKELDDKNIRLIQFYLDKKFISKSLMNIMDSDNIKQCHVDMVEDIKDYFQLDDIVILKNDDAISNAFFLNEPIKELLLEKEANDNINVQYSHIIYESIITNKGQYTLYLYSYLAKNPKNIIICVKKESCNLNNDEISTLKDLLNLSIISINLIEDT